MFLFFIGCDNNTDIDLGTNPEIYSIKIINTAGTTIDELYYYINNHWSNNVLKYPIPYQGTYVIYLSGGKYNFKLLVGGYEYIENNIEIYSDIIMYLPH